METTMTTIHDMAYNTPVKFKNWNVRVTARYCPCERTSAKLIKKLTTLTKGEHAEASKYHASRKVKLQAIWTKVANRAAMEAFGRPWQFTDYIVSGVGRSEFSEVHKLVLRHCAHRSGEHGHLAAAHALLAGVALKQVSGRSAV